jgi:hypothetical protein
MDQGSCAKAWSGEPFFSFDKMDVENRYLLEPAYELTAEKIFDRRRATTLLNQAMSRLREECVASRKGDLFGKVESFLFGGKAKV